MECSKTDTLDHVPTNMFNTFSRAGLAGVKSDIDREKGNNQYARKFDLCQTDMENGTHTR